MYVLSRNIGTFEMSLCVQASKQLEQNCTHSDLQFQSVEVQGKQSEIQCQSPRCLYKIVCEMIK